MTNELACSRFLRARKFVVEDAFKQFNDAAVWRAAESIDDGYNNFDVEEFEQAHKLVGSDDPLPPSDRLSRLPELYSIAVWIFIPRELLKLILGIESNSIRNGLGGATRPEGRYTSTPYRTFLAPT